MAIIALGREGNEKIAVCDNTYGVVEYFLTRYYGDTVFKILSKEIDIELIK